MHFLSNLHLLARVDQLVSVYGAPAMFGLVFLESFGVPVPGESAVVAGGLLAARGDLHVVPLLLSIWIGAVAGDNVGYLIGRSGGRALVLRFGRPIGITRERLATMEDLMRRRGFWIVVTARFVVLLRQLNGIVAGTVLMPWPSFLLANAIGAALWTLAWGLGAYLIADVAAAAAR